MSFVTLKSKIKTKLQAMSQIAQVTDYPNQDFQDYPAVMIRTNGNTSNYETTTENQEVYSFSLFVFQNLDGVFSKEKARNILEELCDIIRDTFDSDEFLSGISMTSDRTMLGIRPTVSKIGEDDAGKWCIAEIELACRVSKSV